MLAMVVDGLKKVGLKEFQVNIGHVDFIQSLMDATGLEEEQKSEIHDLIIKQKLFWSGRDPGQPGCSGQH